MKILIVDDDEISRTSLSFILRGPDTELVQVADGEEAWKMLVAGLRPVACCSEVQVPGLDGLGLLQRTRSHRFLSDLPVVLFSTSAERSTVKAAIAAGVAGFVLKPFRAQPTRATVERVAREYRERRSESVVETRRRLHLSRNEVEQMLTRLKADSGELAEGISSGLSATALASALRRLHSGSLVLGLWKCAAALKQAIATGADPVELVLAVREVEHLVQEQLAESREVAAAA